MTNFVLLHGAYQGPWIWKAVAKRLRDQGHTVYVPCLDGCGERSAGARPGITTETHAAEVVEMMQTEVAQKSQRYWLLPVLRHPIPY